ncbi:hypothetical protein E3J62_07590 [candidate division TA06 bacterium]|uniref:Uncharacterized protein n=1 Tax=candidate division TA06 bacterium TaxID=2250710 RepID=A0A523US96_UNCT6|nr:MAG: hypothetical protein E3J62_07590 [candidate division TA06 bacterium]
MFTELRIYLVGILTAWFFTRFYYWQAHRNYIPFEELLINYMMTIRTQSGDLHAEIVRLRGNNSTLQALSGGLNHSIGEAVLLQAKQLNKKYPKWEPSEAIKKVVDTHSPTP